jgi:small subunit ribosomal protein S4
MILQFQSKKNIVHYTLKQLANSNLHIGSDIKYFVKYNYHYVIGLRNNIIIFNLQYVLYRLRIAMFFLTNIISKRGKLLILDTSIININLIEHLGKKIRQSYYNRKWICGTFTNFKRIYKVFKRVNKLDHNLNYKIKKTYLKFQGFKSLKRPPNITFIWNIQKNKWSFLELFRLQLPIISIIDSDLPCFGISHFIPGNDDSRLSLLFCLKILMKSVILGYKKEIIKFFYKYENIQYFGGYITTMQYFKKLLLNILKKRYILRKKKDNLFKKDNFINFFFKFCLKNLKNSLIYKKINTNKKLRDKNKNKLIFYIKKLIRYKKKIKKYKNNFMYFKKVISKKYKNPNIFYNYFKMKRTVNKILQRRKKFYLNIYINKYRKISKSKILKQRLNKNKKYFLKKIPKIKNLQKFTIRNITFSKDKNQKNNFKKIILKKIIFLKLFEKISKDLKKKKMTKRRNQKFKLIRRYEEDLFGQLTLNNSKKIKINYEFYKKAEYKLDKRKEKFLKKFLKKKSNDFFFRIDERKKKKRKKDKSIFALRLKNRQKLRKFSSQMNVRQLRTYIKKASKTKYLYRSFYKQLESRLDFILYRMNIFLTASFGRQFINHGNCFINEKLMIFPNYQVKYNEIVSIKNKFFFFNLLLERLKNKKIFISLPKYLEVNYRTMSIILINKINKKNIPYPCKLDNNLIATAGKRLKN